MARYIDIEAVGIGKAKRELFLVPEYADGWNNAIEIFENEPTADVVEVVRCKDCVNYKQNPYDKEENLLCQCWCDWLPTEPNDFCSSGERKD